MLMDRCLLESLSTGWGPSLYLPNCIQNISASCDNSIRTFLHRLVDKTPNGVVNEELFENLDDLVWNKRHQLQLRHNFLKAESPLREEVTQSPGDESLVRTYRVSHPIIHRDFAAKF